MIVGIILSFLVYYALKLSNNKQEPTVVAFNEGIEEDNKEEKKDGEKAEEIERIIVILNENSSTNMYLKLNSSDENKDKENEEVKEEAKEKKEEQLAENTKQNTENNNINSNGNSTNNNSTNNNSSTSYNAYYIKVNYEANVVTIYTMDDAGQYTVPLKAMVCSTGTATPTSGTYKIQERWEWLSLVGGVYGHYSTQIVGNILFHSVPYQEKWNPGSLEYWEYDKLRNNLLGWLCKTYNRRCKMDL